MDHQSRFNNRASQSTKSTAASVNRSVGKPRPDSTGGLRLEVRGPRTAHNWSPSGPNKGGVRVSAVERRVRIGGIQHTNRR